MSEDELEYPPLAAAPTAPGRARQRQYSFPLEVTKGLPAMGSTPGLLDRRLVNRGTRLLNTVPPGAPRLVTYPHPMSQHEAPQATSPPALPHGDPLAASLTAAVHDGDLDGLRTLLTERPELAVIRMIGRHGVAGGWRTALHVATDWPGYFPAAPAAAIILLDSGADPNDDTGGGRPETPLHWAASTDDVDVAAVLIDRGARLDTPGGSIGTPLDNAIGYGCWHVARLLVERGAPVNKLWHGAALGMLARLEQLLASESTADELDNAFWQACHGGQRRAAERLLTAGANPDAVPDYANGQRAAEAAIAADTRRDLLVSWLAQHTDAASPD